MILIPFAHIFTSWIKTIDNNCIFNRESNFLPWSLKLYVAVGLHVVLGFVIFTTSRGRIKPGKHLCLALGLKSITGSRKVLEVLNQFGHCISYNITESIETDLATVIPGLCTGLAWDNYDENSETLSGRGTIHDTVGICYQNIEPVIEEPEQMDNGPDNATPLTCEHVGKKPKLKRTFCTKDTALEPYRKKPKISDFQYQVKESVRPATLKYIEGRDTFWMMNVAMSSDPTPMWPGWNALVTEDPLPQQRIAYMENLSLLPTRLDVVAETLNISKKVAAECGDEYAVVHYDLAVAKLAMLI